MSALQEYVLDDGYRFGLGVYETIFIKKRKGILITYHLDRLKAGLDVLGIPMPVSLEEELDHRIQRMPEEKDVIRVSVSQDNTVWEMRKNPYTQQQYAKGFTLVYSTVRRNETSPMTGIKSLNQGDNILQRRWALNRGFDEAVFLNSNGEITEGTVSNLFFVSDGKLYTPPVECGLLAGTVRRWLIEKFDVNEISIFPQDMNAFQEMFVTNALLGIMPVRQADSVIFPERRVTNELLGHYKKMTEE